MERIIAYVIANVGTTFSATSLAKFLKNEKRTVAPETILNYIKYCCDAYLFYQVSDNISGQETFERECSPLLQIRYAIIVLACEGHIKTGSHLLYKAAAGCFQRSRADSNRRPSA